MILDRTELMQKTKNNCFKILDNIEDIKRLLLSSKLNKEQKQDFVLQDIKYIKKCIEKLLQDNYALSVDEIY